MESFSITDIGITRKVNQDFVFKEENPIGNLPNLFILADGMGGHNAGDYASRFCVEKVVEEIKISKLKTPISIIEAAIKNAHELLLKESKENVELDGMGTTFVVATIVHQTMYVANIGDSRLYVINSDIRQITEDHSLVEAMIKRGELDKEDARQHPNKNVITRALGAAKYISPDYFEVNLKESDKILMCSDGLSNMIEDEEIMGIIVDCQENIELAANRLVEVANGYGGKDNISIIIIKP